MIIRDKMQFVQSLHPRHAIPQPCKHATRIQPCKHANMQARKHANMQTCRHANMHWGMQTCPNSAMQTDKYESCNHAISANHIMRPCGHVIFNLARVLSPLKFRFCSQPLLQGIKKSSLNPKSILFWAVLAKIHIPHSIHFTSSFRYLKIKGDF